jgi:hypothetical protein
MGSGPMNQPADELCWIINTPHAYRRTASNADTLNVEGHAH